MTVDLTVIPVITETTIGLTKLNWYTFRVPGLFTKNQITKAIEDLFTVNVLVVKTHIVKEGSRRSLRTRKVRVGRVWKKALVRIKPDQKIAVFDISTN